MFITAGHDYFEAKSGKKGRRNHQDGCFSKLPFVINFFDCLHKFTNTSVKRGFWKTSVFIQLSCADPHPSRSHPSGSRDCLVSVFLLLLSAALRLALARLQGRILQAERKNTWSCSWLLTYKALMLASISSETGSEQQKSCFHL